MRRVLVIALVLAAGIAAVVASASGKSGDPEKPDYTIELDNAFGIVNGADVKVAGVRAGHVTGMRVEPHDHHALVDIAIEKTGFGSLRTDAFCETQPQSLIGEYFVDCRPGTTSERLKPGATLPIAQTASTIPLDLVNNIMRRPYRERLGIILDELGAGGGGRASPIQAALKRASPARASAAALPTSRRPSSAPSRRCARPTRCLRSSPTRTRRWRTSRTTPTR